MPKQLSRSQIWKRALTVAGLLYLLVSAISVSLAASYTVLNGDDYAVDFTPMSFGIRLSAALKKDLHAWLHWQGAYFHKFVCYILHPFWGNGYGQLRVTMFVFSLLFILSFLFLVYVLSQHVLGQSKHVSLASCCVMVFLFFNLQCYPDIYFHFNTSTSYLLPGSFALLSAACFLLLIRTGKRRYTRIACVLCFLAAGGTLMISGAMCYLFLLLLVSERVKTKQWNRPAAFVFAVSFAGALFNALAPGNFERLRFSEEPGGNPLLSVLHTIKYAYLNTETLLRDSILLAGLLAIVILGCVNSRQENKPQKESLLLAALALPAPLAALYPLLLGNHNAGIPDRGAFIFHLALVLTLFVFCYRIGLYLGKTVLTTLFLSLLFAVVFNNTTILSLQQYTTLRDLAQGTYAAYYREALDILDYLESTSETDVVISLPEAPENYMGLAITENEDDYFNSILASHYDKRSIRSSE